jgi:hypothetical protein
MRSGSGGKILRQCCQLHQLHNVADFAGMLLTAQHFSSSKISPRKGSSSVTRPSGVKKSPVCEDDLVRLQELLTNTGLR